jgi:Trypsin-like peptidase domain
MPDIEKLYELSVDDLLDELRARAAKASRTNVAGGAEPSASLSEFDDESIAAALKRNQRVIYGTDDRVEVVDLPRGPDLDDADSVVALFRAASITDNGNGTSTLQTQSFASARNLCLGERFRDQPVGAFCSGFLVGPGLIATAGHCVDAANVTNIRFVFGFRMRNATTAETVIRNDEIYRGVALVGRLLEGTGADWALVAIDRPVPNHRIVRIRRAGRINNAQAVHVIGHPSGLPTKFAAGAAVRNNQPDAFFVANLDTYGGNSGSPVFNSNTHLVEGILVRGETDFAPQGTCYVSLVCPTTGCRGEDCTRTTKFENLVPSTGGQILFYNAANGEGAVSRIDPAGNYTFVSGISGFPTVWTHIVGTRNGSLLFYSPSNGVGATATLNALGYSFVSSLSGFGLWTHITAANAGSVLFYNADTGVGATSRIDNSGQYALVGGLSGFATGWTHIVGTSNGSVLFYNASTGLGATARIDTFGNYAFVGSLPGFGQWTHITAANDGSLLFYNAATGEGATSRIDAAGNYTFVGGVSGLATGWSHVVGTSNGSVLFYNAATRTGATATIDSAGNYAFVGSLSGFAPWSHITGI